MRSKSAITTLTIAILAGVSLGTAFAQGQLDAPIASGYLFRGLYLTEDPVFQPSLTYSAKNGIAFNTWGNMELQDDPNMYGADTAGEFSEVDLTVSYTLPVKQAGITVGVAQYLYPSATITTDSGTTGINAPATRELFVVLSLPVILAPKLSVYTDVDYNDGGIYANLGVGHDVKIKDLTLGASASIGWANDDYQAYYVGVDESAVNELTLGVKASYPINEAVSASASATYFKLLDSDIEDGAEAWWDNDGNNVMGSVGVSFTF